VSPVGPPRSSAPADFFGHCGSNKRYIASRFPERPGPTGGVAVIAESGGRHAPTQINPHTYARLLSGAIAVARLGAEPTLRQRRFGHRNGRADTKDVGADGFADASQPPVTSVRRSPAERDLQQRVVSRSNAISVEVAAGPWTGVRIAPASENRQRTGLVRIGPARPRWAWSKSTPSTAARGRGWSLRQADAALAAGENWVR
jgi:hypothetical protein